MAYCTRQTTNTLHNHQHSNLSLPSSPPFPSPSLPSLLLPLSLPLPLPLPSSHHSHEGQRTVALHISFTHIDTCLCTLNLQQHGRGGEEREVKFKKEEGMHAHVICTPLKMCLPVPAARRAWTPAGPLERCCHRREGGGAHLKYWQ